MTKIPTHLDPHPSLNDNSTLDLGGIKITKSDNSEEIFSNFKTGKPLMLSDKDIDRIKELNNSIISVPQDIVGATFDIVIQTLTNENPMNRLIRGDDRQINAYLACDQKEKQLHIKYAFSNGESIKNIKIEINKFLKRSRKLGYESIIFNGFNEKLVRIMERFGFEAKHDDFKTYILNLVAPTNPSLEEQLHYLETDANASQVRNTLSGEDKKHVETLLEKRNNSKQDPEIYNLYGAIHTLQNNNIDIKTFGTLHKLYKKSNELHAIKVKKDNAKLDSQNLIKYLDITEDYPNYTSILTDIEHTVLTSKDNKLAILLNNVLNLYNIPIPDQNLDRNFLNELDGTGAIYIGTLESDIYPYSAYSLKNMKELQYETAVLRHCVGTSDFYIKKVKNQKIAVISLRDSENIPKWTIEYDIANQAIIQFKGGGDVVVNSLPGHSELPLKTFDLLHKNGFPIQKVNEKLDYNIIRDNKNGIHKKIENEVLRETLARKKENTLLKGSVTCDETFREEEILYLCSLPGIKLDLTQLPNRIKNKITQIKGSIKDDSETCFYGKLTHVGGDARFDNLTSAKGLEALTHIGGDASFGSLTSANGLEALTHIGGNASFGSLTSANGLENLNYIRGNAGFGSITSAKGLKSLTYIGGYGRFIELTNAEGLEALTHIGGNAGFGSLTSAKGLEALTHIGRGAWFSKLTNAEGLEALSHIGEDALFGSLTSAKGLEALTHIGGDAVFESLTSAEGLKSLTHIGRDAWFSELTSAEGLKSLTHIGRGAWFSKLTSAEGLEALSHIDGDARFGELTRVEQNKIPALRK